MRIMIFLGEIQINDVGIENQKKEGNSGEERDSQIDRDRVKEINQTEVKRDCFRVRETERQRE